MCCYKLQTGEKKPSFLLAEDKELRKKWIYFVNRKNWAPTKYSVACIDHFHDKFIKHRKSQCKLNWELHPIPTIYPVLTVSHHFLILQKSQGGHREKEYCQNPTNLRFSQTEIKLKISHHLQVNTHYSVMTSENLMT